MERCTPRTLRRSRWAATIAFLSIALSPVAALADDNNAGSMAKGIGVGTAAALSSLIYGPIKILYATGGVIVGGLGWAFSGGDAEVAKTVITPAVYGDYVISPSVLTGDDSLEFYGRAPGQESLDVSAAPPDDW
jgi:hypothetical protein